MSSIDADEAGEGLLMVQMPLELKDQLRAAAAAEERTMSAQVRLLVTEWLARRQAR